MKCLSDAVIQAVVDREAPADAVAHVASCHACTERVRRGASRVEALATMLDVPVPGSGAFDRRVEAALAAGTRARGATRLRDEPAAVAWHATRWWSAAAVAAATLAGVLFVVPLFKQRATVSAAEILARSATRLSQSPTAGIEVLEYQLVLSGVPRDVMPDQANGTYHISQLIDHDVPGHFRYSSYDPAGQLLTSIAQDPIARRRVSVVRVDDQFYRFDFAIPTSDFPSLPELERLHMEASVAMMQASGQQLLQVLDNGRQYRVEVPEISSPSSSALWDLSKAHVLIDASDYRIIEFSAAGTFLRQPYSLSYALIRRENVAAVPPDAFDVPSQDGEIMVAGQGTPNPVGDMFIGALRALGQNRPGR